MKGIYPVQITVKEILKGKCSLGFKVGDTWTMDKSLTPNGMCATAFTAIFPAIRTLRYGGTMPFGKDPDVVNISCPDAHIVVVYELRRLHPTTGASQNKDAGTMPTNPDQT
jgi:uncharacterized repeat protein (TIGR04076 family)